MINPVLTYLHQYYGDDKFHALTPLMKQNPSVITETYIQNLHLEGFIELKEKTAFDKPKNQEGIQPISGRMTKKGMYYMEGNRKIATIIEAIENQTILNLLLNDGKGHEEQVALAPYVYGKDSDEQSWVWGTVRDGEHKHRRFLLDDITITETAGGTFEVDHEMKLSQPRDIEVVAQVNY
ncbi:hypothetical protein MKJ04_17155 [Pontibacter sp. E15-1]|uniref:hypothetical protein n=1 Tax=Pontibacter sp. E15-1 TaxID=2919918 RepID=UPI001F4F5A59|nr:hypothetical protein [Pontibacter sp. E15-1]MCJ8166576.1 hypothetical protein [Pontibacter sp. E15-1]